MDNFSDISDRIPETWHEGQEKPQFEQPEDPAVVVALCCALDVCQCWYTLKLCHFILWVKTNSNSDHKSHLKFFVSLEF